MRMAGCDDGDPSQGANRLNASVVKESRGLPQQVSVLRLHEQAALAYSQFRHGLHGVETGFQLHHSDAKSLRLEFIAGGPALASGRDVLAFIGADFTHLRGVGGVGMFDGACGARPDGHGVPSLSASAGETAWREVAYKTVNQSTLAANRCAGSWPAGSDLLLAHHEPVKYYDNKVTVCRLAYRFGFVLLLVLSVWTGRISWRPRLPGSTHTNTVMW